MNPFKVSMIISKIFISLIIMMMLWMMVFLMSFNKKMDKSMMSPFECGFTYPSKTKMPLSIQFTLTSFMFLIFDVELSILITSIWTMKNFSKEWITCMMMFLILMVLSIIYEMMKNSSKWM
uniref:NADH-ubiquinone oxidoreductase chain 3 n=1 Tax=Mutilla europaea TaxID=2749339 RepID=A0A7L7S6E8_9HYME|nr:NADH dehydrogenase subunit 3 [Mutilla europaea]